MAAAFVFHMIETEVDREGMRAWIALFLLWGAAFCLACRLPLSGGSSSAAGEDTSAAGRMASGCRMAFGESFYSTADLFFHKGVPHSKKEAFHDRLFQRMAEAVSPHDHVHASGAEIADIMPWLRLAVRCNPHDMDSYLVAAFWLARELGRPDLALDVLSEAQQNNPNNYHVYLERGRVYLTLNRLEKSRRDFDAGVVFWPGEEDPESEDAKLGLRNLLLHRALLLEVSGETSGAAADLRRILAIFSGTPGVLERCWALERGEPPSTSAREVLVALLNDKAQARSTCHREHEEAEHTH